MCTSGDLWNGPELSRCWLFSTSLVHWGLGTGVIIQSQTLTRSNSFCLAWPNKKGRLSVHPNVLTFLLMRRHCRLWGAPSSKSCEALNSGIRANRNTLNESLSTTKIVKNRQPRNSFDFSVLTFLQAITFRCYKHFKKTNSNDQQFKQYHQDDAWRRTKTPIQEAR